MKELYAEAERRRQKELEAQRGVQAQGAKQLVCLSQDTSV